VIARAALLGAVLAAAVAAPAAAGEPDATAPAYTVALRGSDGGFTWRGRETLALTNPGPAALDRVWVRLWGNGRFGCRGRRAVRIGAVHGATPGHPRLRCTAVRLRLAAPLAPGARGSVSFHVAIRVPRAADRFGRGDRGLALLSNAIPALAHRERGHWRLDRWFGSGEAWTYPAADWNVRLDAPPRVSVAAPGVRLPDGSRHVQHGRDYSFAAGHMRFLRGDAGGVAVTVWAAQRARPARLERALAIARRRLARLTALFGPYGWPDLQLVLTEVTAMEHTGLVMTPDVDLVITHELAHQWWFGSVGDDQARSPWLDEAFASFAEEAARNDPPWCVRPGPDAPVVTRGVAYWRPRDERYGVVYYEGACLLDMLQARMGRGRFRAALRQYAIAQRYGWSTAARFRAAMDAASPAPLGDLWRRYRIP
jgi:hypothetical protein